MMFAQTAAWNSSEVETRTGHVEYFGHDSQQTLDLFTLTRLFGPWSGR